MRFSSGKCCTPLCAQNHLTSRALHAVAREVYDEARALFGNELRKRFSRVIFNRCSSSATEVSIIPNYGVYFVNRQISSTNCQKFNENISIDFRYKRRMGTRKQLEWTRIRMKWRRWWEWYPSRMTVSSHFKWQPWSILVCLCFERWRLIESKT